MQRVSLIGRQLGTRFTKRLEAGTGIDFDVKNDAVVINVLPSGSGLTELVQDTTPQLGGELDAQSNKIINLTDPTNAQDAATKAYVDANIGGGGLTDVVDDTSPQLGGNLDVNNFQIISTSNGNIEFLPDGTGNTIVNNGMLFSPLNAGNHEIINLATPVNNQDAANKAYVDGIVSSSDLGDLSDVDLTGIVPGSILRYTGSQWQPSTAVAAGSDISVFNLDAGGNTLNNLADPVTDGQAANKEYVDAVRGLVEQIAFSPNDYTPVNMELGGHLEGIDDRLGEVDNDICFKPSRVTFVSSNGSDATGTGSYLKPYATLTNAVANAVFGEIIIIFPGEFAGDFTVPVDNLTIVGMAPRSSHPTVINGSITMPPGRTRLRIVDLRIDGQGSAPCIDDTGSDGRNYYDNVTFTVGDTTSDIYYRVTNGGRWHQFVDCEFSGTGRIVLDGRNAAISSFLDLTIQGYPDVAQVEMNEAGQNVFVERGRNVGPFIHEAGDLTIRECRNVREDASGNSVESTANSGSGTLIIRDSELSGRILKTGTCDYTLQGVTRDPSQDTLTGTQLFADRSNDISSARSAVNYTASDQSLLSHLDGIDNALGNKAEAFMPANVWYVATNGNDSTGTGSADRPYQTIATAFVAASAGDIIILCPGSYNESIDLNKDISLIGMDGPINILKSRINGTVTVSNGQVNLKNLTLNNSGGSVNDYALLVTNVSTTAGCKIEDCIIQRPTNRTDVAARFEGGPWSGSVTLQEVWSNGKWEFAQSGFVRGDQLDAFFADMEVSSATATVQINGINAIGTITHSAGVLVLLNARSVFADGSGKSIISTASNPTDALLLGNISTLQDGTFAYGQIDKSGTCPYSVSGSAINPDFDLGAGPAVVGRDLFNGVNLQLGELSSQIIVPDISPSYSVAVSDDSLQAHLVGISDAIGERARLVSSAPTSSSDPGDLGDYFVDSSFVYFHNGSDWVRVAVSTF